ncbi:MAG: hypothetical protein VKJ02_07085 [Snowella sp.]|nr:hypothetical protein [Snowella sp.]
MSEIKPIKNEFAGIEGNYGIINQGTGYAVVNILTKEMKAHSISSYLDALKTAEHLNNKDKEVKVIDLEFTTVSSTNTTHNQETNDSLERAIQGLKPDIQQLIKKYAPETVRVKKDSNILGYSWYKCYNQNGSRIGTVRGKSGDRYWQYGGLDDIQRY